MDSELFEKMDSVQLKSYLQFLLWQYRVVDAFWFIYTEELFGRDAAENTNEKVWGKAAELAARDIKKRFNTEDKGLKGFVKALKLFPWAAIIQYEIEEKDGEVVISVPHCPPQEARVKRGLGEYVCKHMHYEEFKRFAEVIDPGIKVECVFAPPDSHPSECFCRWRFTCR
jgi:hypothetical protein